MTPMCGWIIYLLFGAKTRGQTKSEAARPQDVNPRRGLVLHNIRCRARAIGHGCGELNLNEVFWKCHVGLHARARGLCAGIDPRSVRRVERRVVIHGLEPHHARQQILFTRPSELEQAITLSKSVVRLFCDVITELSLATKVADAVVDDDLCHARIFRFYPLDAYAGHGDARAVTTSRTMESTRGCDFSRSVRETRGLDESARHE